MSQLKYSELTRSIYFVSKNKKTEIDENNFIQILLLWMHKNIDPKNCKTITRDITVDGKPHYQLTLKKVI